MGLVLQIILRILSQFGISCAGADPGFLNGGWGPSQARIQDFLKGGGGEDIHKHPPPLDIVRVTSSALRKIEKHPHSWTFTLPKLEKHPHSWTFTSQGGGGGDRSRFKGGGVITPVTPPLDPPLHLRCLHAKKGGGVQLWAQC